MLFLLTYFPTTAVQDNVFFSQQLFAKKMLKTTLSLHTTCMYLH